MIGKHSDINIQFTDAVVHVHNEHYRTKDRALGNTALDRNLCRWLVTETDSFRSAKYEAAYPLQDISSSTYLAEFVQ
ncbi:unnamed protein product [Dibothriocephalus latus]|uniref:Uncharacterized protein n=1 Tax=Dibothriocephalus latus TaxID=60516 RepID=A0A3P7MJL8_DIBLA|nr:unnamed protein product [Dibothriocephalus latus]